MNFTTRGTVGHWVTRKLGPHRVAFVRCWASIDIARTQHGARPRAARRLPLCARGPRAGLQRACAAPWGDLPPAAVTPTVSHIQHARGPVGTPPRPPAVAPPGGPAAASASWAESRKVRPGLSMGAWRQGALAGMAARSGGTPQPGAPPAACVTNPPRAPGRLLAWLRSCRAWSDLRTQLQLAVQPDGLRDHALRCAARKQAWEQ